MIKTDNNPNGSDEDWTLESEEVRMSKIVNRFISQYLAIQEPNAGGNRESPGVQGAVQTSINDGDEDGNT